MKRRPSRAAVGPLILVIVGSFSGCGDDDEADSTVAPIVTTAANSESSESMALDDQLSELSGAGVFVGGVALTGNLVAIHYDHTDPASPGMTIYVTDGLPDGNAEWFEGTAAGGAFSFQSTSGTATIEGTIEQFETDGTVTLADGVTRNFFTRPAGDGAGIFEVTVDDAGAWRGKSLDGSTFEARQEGMFVSGAVVSTAGMRYEFRHNDLTRRLGYEVDGGAPDTYLTVITRQATEIQGRGGDVRGGKPSANVVALDLDQSAAPTPGVFHGRVAFTTDRMNIEIAEDDTGVTVLRTYVSDSEPEPAGDIQWFAEPLSGSKFSMTSKSGDSTITGTISDDGITGEIALPEQAPRPFFAAPAGQGAGIYTVEVAEDRHHTGSSEQGATLDLVYEDGTVFGTLTSPEGEEFAMLGADLADAYEYDDEYSKPGTYTAFVAPRGRYVFGRDGSVRTGKFGGGIIGLDKKC